MGYEVAMKKLLATFVLALAGCASVPISDLEKNGRAGPMARESEAIDAHWGLTFEGRKSKPPRPPETPTDKNKPSETTRR